MTSSRDRPKKEKGVTQIEVTPEMVVAGVHELREKMFGQPLDMIVVDVFYAMIGAGSPEPFSRLCHDALVVSERVNGAPHPLSPSLPRPDRP